MTSKSGNALANEIGLLELIVVIISWSDDETPHTVHGVDDADRSLWL